MRRSTTSILASILAAALALPVAAQDLSVDERRAIVETWYETMDYDMLADELEWVHASGFFGGETLTTRAQVEEQLTPFYFEAFDDIAVDIHRVEVGEDSVFSFGTYNLKPKNSDTVHTAEFVHVWTVDAEGRRDGLVQYADTWAINGAFAGGRVLGGE